MPFFLSRIGTNRIFSLPKCGKFAYTKLGTLEPWVSRLSKNRISYPPKCRNELMNARCPRYRGFQNSNKSHFQAPKIKKICWTVSINRLHSFHPVSVDKTSSFRQLIIQFSSTGHCVSVSRPSGFC